VALLHDGRLLACDDPARLRAAAAGSRPLEDVFVNLLAKEVAS
jgi:hypothetical protein